MEKTSDNLISPTKTAAMVAFNYAVESVEPTAAPDGSNASDWFRYVLRSGRSTINGQRRGSRRDVQEYAAQCATQLNARALEGKSVWSPRGKKPATG